MKMLTMLRAPLAALALALCSSWSQAHITAAASVTGPLQSSHFNATVVPTSEFLDGRAKIWLFIIHQDHVYVHSGAGGFVPYQGGEAPAFRTISSARENIDFQQWDLRTLAGAQIFIGYGHHMMDMLDNQRFAMVHQVAAAPTPPAPVADPVAHLNGTYRCYNEYFMQATVTLTATAGRAVVDVSRVYDIPVYTLTGSFYSQEADGKRNYASQQFPLHFISLDTKPQSRFPLAFAYQGSYYGTAKIWVCER